MCVILLENHKTKSANKTQKDTSVDFPCSACNVDSYTHILIGEMGGGEKGKCRDPYLGHDFDLKRCNRSQTPHVKVGGW